MNASEQIDKIIETSGNSFHSKVASWLKGNGWDVVVSPYYMDQSHGKAREIDLVAEKVCFSRGSHRHSEVKVLVRLFVECKFVPAPSVFWFAERNQKLVEELVCTGTPFRLNNTKTQGHHYLAGSKSVAKVFATSPAREADNEPFYKALNQVLNAKVSMRGRAPIARGLPEHRGYHLTSLEFPVVVCSSFAPLRRVEFFGLSEPKPIDSNFQLEVQYAYRGSDGDAKSDYFIVDFVEFAQLSLFVQALEFDAEIAANLIT